MENGGKRERGMGNDGRRENGTKNEKGVKEKDGTGKRKKESGVKKIGRQR